MRNTLPLLLFLALTVALNSCSKDSTAAGNEENESIQKNDPAAREAAKKLYTDYYIASAGSTSDIAWSGNEPTCLAGEVPQNIKNKILQRLEYYRKAVGLNSTIIENVVKSEKAQEAALMMLANGTLDHFPPDNWKCFSQNGKEGAGNSLLAFQNNAAAIDAYIRDMGQSNGPVGHRRWLLWPRLQEIGIGNTQASNAIWVLGNAGNPPADAPEYISWPPKGYAPKQLAFERWSFSIADADFTNTTIIMKNPNNETVAVNIEPLDNQFGDRTVVWVPSLNINTIAEDMTFSVAINNVIVGGVAKNYSYEVTLFDVNDQ